MTSPPASRIVDQRIRNRIMDAIETLADGAAGLSHVGVVNYFEDFYDWVPHRGAGKPFENAAVKPQERTLILAVSRVLDDACDATAKNISESDFVATGWPGKIQAVAHEALELMRHRGRFSDEHEEPSPGETEAFPHKT